MRIEYYNLNNYLYHFEIKKESKCIYKENNKTIAYFLLKYKIFIKQKEKFIKEIEIKEIRIEKLFKDFKYIKYIL